MSHNLKNSKFVAAARSKRAKLNEGRNFLQLSHVFPLLTLWADECFGNQRYLHFGLARFWTLGTFQILDDLDMIAVDTTFGLLVPENHISQCIFESSKRQNQKTKLESNRVAFQNEFKELWPESAIGCSSESYKCKRGGGLLEWQTMPFHLGIAALVWAVSRQRADYNVRCTSAFTGFVRLVCKCNPTVQIQRIGDSALFTINLDQTCLIDCSVLWTSQAWAVCVYPLLQRLQENECKTWVSFPQNGFMDLPSYLLLCFDYYVGRDASLKGYAKTALVSLANFAQQNWKQWTKPVQVRSANKLNTIEAARMFWRANELLRQPESGVPLLSSPVA